jgi:hypothetical protein
LRGGREVNRKKGGCGGSYMRVEMTAHGESDRTASIQRLLRFNGHDGTAADGSHMATVKRWWSWLGRETPNFGRLSPK